MKLTHVFFSHDFLGGQIFGGEYPAVGFNILGVHPWPQDDMTSQPTSPRLQLLQEKGGWIQIILSQEVQISTCFTIAEICKKHTSIWLSIEWNLLLLGTTSFVDSLLHVFWQMRKKKQPLFFGSFFVSCCSFQGGYTWRIQHWYPTLPYLLWSYLFQKHHFS